MRQIHAKAAARAEWRPARIAIVVAMLLLASGAALAQPFPGGTFPHHVRTGFLVSPPTSFQFTTAATPLASCAAYATTLSSPAGGVPSHPGYCQYATFQPLFEGLPFAQYWQAVKTGAIAPPFPMSNGRFMICASAGPLLIHLSASGQNSVLSFTGAASVGPFCAAEWARNDPGGSPTSNSVTAVLRTYANYLNQFYRTQLSSISPICTPKLQIAGRPGAVAQMADALERQLGWAVARMQLIWPPQAGTAAASCPLPHCNQCNRGWVGTIRADTAIGDYFNETDIYYLGGGAIGSNMLWQIPTDWVTSGYGFDQVAADHSYAWSLNGGVPGACPPGNNVCTQIYSSGQFGEINSPASAPNALTVTQKYQGSTSTSMSNFSEPSFNGVGIQNAGGSSAGSKTSMCLPTYLTSGQGGSCTRTWTWNLGMQ